MPKTVKAFVDTLSLALGYRDPLIQLHSERVRALSWLLGIRAGLADHDLVILELGAIFHDIGKIGVPDHILQKPALLTHDEWIQVKRHPEMGEALILLTNLEDAEPVSKAVRHHHEHFDGLGYPDGLSAVAIPLASRIISITDSYDAMAVTRPYHQRPKRHSVIMEILRSESGTKHDPILLNYFCEIIDQTSLRASDVEPLEPRHPPSDDDDDLDDRMVAGLC